ncbi:MAG: tRNA (adenosine(37)-N6)-dimethylallyltransferase MiaA [Dehalococcoidales bacterium]
MKKIIAIVGPTGIGKSNLAISIGQKFDCEIISVDSRQVYRFMDIGTAKPPPQEMALVPHHLIDIINPDEPYSLAEYQEQCLSKIEDISQRNKVPVLVGGSGQYVWAVLEGWSIPKVVPNIEYRQLLEKKAEEVGTQALYQQLQALDPKAAEKIDKFNTRRVIRALEIVHNSKDNKQNKEVQKEAQYNALIIGLTTEREELYRRVDKRVDLMIENGLIAETRRLLQSGYSEDLPSMSGIGYKQTVMYINGQISLDEAIRQIKYDTHRYVRSQYNWFKLKDDRIKWFDVQNDIEPDIINLIKDFLISK